MTHHTLNGIIYSQIQLSLELRNCFLYVHQSVRPMPLILANSYQITSILHMVLSTVTVSVFIEKCFLKRPTSGPFFWVFWGDFLGNFGAQVSAHLRLSGLDFYVSGIFRIIPRRYYFCLAQYRFLGPAGTGESLGPKFAERNPFVQW